MDTSALVGQQIEDGQKLIHQLTCDRFDIAAAFWIKFSDTYESTGPWFFYLVSAEEEKVGTRGAYRAVHAAIQRIPPPWGPWITISELRIVNPKEALARHVLSVKQRYPEDAPIRLKPGLLGDFAVEELYIYPTATPAKESSLDEIRHVAEKLKGFVDQGDKTQALQAIDQIITMSGQRQK